MNTPLIRFAAAEGFAADVLTGLSQYPKHLSSKYFYDEAGSQLFEKICELSEYYPTRVETELLRAHAHEIAGLAGQGASLVEFGAGALRKVEILLDALDRPAVYVPIDISGEFLVAHTKLVRERRLGLAIRPIVGDFTSAFDLRAALAGGKGFGFFPGSTIGNLDRAEALKFLRRVRQQLGNLLIGVDLVKDPALLHRAYNDASCVTAAFNKNVLARINRELGADFDSETFAHYAFYNPHQRRIEMHLVSLATQTVRVLGQDVAFEEGETVHTENSYKYTVEDFQELAIEAGFAPLKVWIDEKKLFSLHWLAG